MGRKRGKKGKAARNASANESAEGNEEAYTKAPHSFVFHRGKVGKTVKELVTDVRKIMEPFTASSLKVRKANVMKDFLTIAGPLHVSHFIVFSKTDIGVYMKLICVPRGPTLTFKVNEFSLARDVLSFQKHPDVESKVFINHAVMVTNLPSDTMENKLMNVSFKNMFPSINPSTVQLNNMRRSVLVNYDPESKCVDIRHYTMKVVPTGVSRTVKKLMRSNLPDLGHHRDIADLFLGQGLSDSEGEQDGPHSQVSVTQKVKDRGIAKNAVSAIRLKEIGPRLNLQLIKIEEGFESGNVLHHALVQKTPEELEVLQKKRHIKQKKKLALKQKQDANVRKKKEAKEEQVKKTLEGMKRKKQEMGNEDDEDDNTQDSSGANLKVDSDDDDIEYYKQEVGQEPEPEMFSQSKKRKREEGNDLEPKSKKRRHDKFSTGKFDKKGASSPRFDRKGASSPRFDRKGASSPRFDKKGGSTRKFDKKSANSPRFDKKGASTRKFDKKSANSPRFDKNGARTDKGKKKFSVNFSRTQAKGGKKFQKTNSSHKNMRKKHK